MCDGNCANCKGHEEKAPEVEILNVVEDVVQALKDQKTVVAQDGLFQIVIVGVEPVELPNGAILDAIMQQTNMLSGYASVGSTKIEMITPMIQHFLEKEEDACFVVVSKEAMNEDADTEIQKVIDATIAYINAEEENESTEETK